VNWNGTRIQDSGDEESQPGPAIGVSRFQLAVVLLMLLAGVLAYAHLPARIPMHWNMRGEIDDWAARSFASVFFQPLIVLAMILLAWALPRIDPFKRSYARFRGSYYLIIDLIAAFMALIYAMTLYAAFRPGLPVGILVPVAVGLLLAVIGNQVAKVKRNFFVGFRTPWTLASETVWVRTHRIGGRIFLLAGLGSALSAFLPAPWNMAIFMALVLGAALSIVLISYVIYHRLETQGRLDGRVGGTGGA
jgi:uncharacterized membrane protein